MVYKGRLKVAGDPGEGIPVDLSIDDVYVDLVSGDENLGRWRMDVVELSRLAGNEFAMGLDGEQMIFAAADPLGFAYNAVTTIEEISGRLRKKRGRFRKRSETARRANDEWAPTVEIVPAEHSSDLTDLLPPSPDLGRLLPPPVGRAAHDEESPEPALPVEPVEQIEPVEDIEPVDELERAVIEAHDGSDDLTEVEMLDLHPDETVEPVEMVIEGDTEVLDVEQVELPAVDIAIEPTTIRSEPRDDDVEMDDVEMADFEMADFEMVDVEVVDAPADDAVGDGAAVSTDTDGPADTNGVGQESAVFEAPVPVDSVDVEPAELAESSGAASSADRGEPVEVESLGPSTATEGPAPDDPEPDPAQPAVASPAHPAGSSPAQPAVASPAQPAGSGVAPQAQGRRRRFGRSRAEDTHVHDYAESKTVGGITRRVCGHCGHVSFAGEDVYQEWK